MNLGDSTIHTRAVVSHGKDARPVVYPFHPGNASALFAVCGCYKKAAANTCVPVFV